MHLSRLRLYGFKSFGEKTEVNIEPGLNGIIGPNGCGKSNLVEALRWVMGGASAKNFRAGDMEDVIFAGTAKRPARNLAEVSVLLDNSDHSAPHPFQNISQIEVTRRIERDKGSTYLVNGKVVRARDVATLFADALTGSNSPALVSQGKVAQLIGAKPSERRHVLEEAAGVTALFSRRHEAQLRLKAASENLEKLDVALREIDNRTGTLRRQAKQADQYTSLNETVNTHDMALLWYAWVEAREAVRGAESAFEQAETNVRENLIVQTRLNTESTAPLERMPSLRDAEARARAALQKLQQTAFSIEQAQQTRNTALADIQQQIEAVLADMAQATSQSESSKTQHETIAAELATLNVNAKAMPEKLAASTLALEACATALKAKEEAVFTLMAQKRSREAEYHQAQQNAARTAARVVSLETALRETNAALEALQTEAAHDTEQENLNTERETLKTRLADSETTVEANRTALEILREQLAEAQKENSAKNAELAHARSELAAVNRSLQNRDTATNQSLLMGVTVQAGYERALAVAAGSAGFKGVWQETSVTAPRFENGIVPLAQYVTGDEKLAAFLNAVGVVESFEAYAPHLKAGQTLVTLKGAVLRWDGLSLPETLAESDDNAVTLEYKTRQAALTLEVEALEKNYQTTAAALASLQQSVQEKTATLRAEEAQLGATRNALSQLERTAQAAIDRANKRNAQLVTLQEKANQQHLDLESARTENNVANEVVKASYMAADDKVVLDLETAEQNLAQLKTEHGLAQSTHAALNAEHQQQAKTLEALQREQERLVESMQQQDTRATDLLARQNTLQTRFAQLEAEDKADDSAHVLDGLRTRIVEAEQLATNAADALTVCENDMKRLTAETRAAEEALANARETRGGAIVALEAARDRFALSIADIDGRFAMEPRALEAEVNSLFSEGVPSRNTCKKTRDEAARAREALGPVNLQARDELAQIEGQHATIITERADLAAAIERLHEAIRTLNSEARGRLQTAFDTINSHFQSLFQRLFGGGEARLGLVGDDILDAGLEIYAQPPGKALQSLSLLSGGEQALTALTLIFAMFACNPAPICVLDEVDAPLDDANIERVVTLLEEMSRRFTTRFLVITHHRLTMARMQRIYGVTMAERGISQLVSVDLDLLSSLEGSAAAPAHQVA